ncbi:MAG: serine/threonine-protein phosphatase [Phycisphaeraceae bacterium]|nr:serine/threonine-protein phosphatase [Phycisphaeraceae bacterium]
MTATVTSDFRSEYETQRELFLRRRVLWFTGCLAGVFALRLLWQSLMAMFGEASLDQDFVVNLLVRSTILVLNVAAFVYLMNRRKVLTRKGTVRIVVGLILAMAFLLYAPAHILAALFTESFMGGTNRSLGPAPAWLFQVMLLHLLASAIIPWTPRESLLPLIPVLIVHAFILLFGGDSVIIKVIALAFSNVIILPGWGLTWWRQSRFHARFHYSALRGRYTQMKRELTDAQRIHEALFPKPIRQGRVHFDYLYEPMRQIGGDFLYTHRHGQGDGAPLSVVIIDVTGHGIPAALTVNRLYGELQRLFAEDPDLTPGGALEAINRYVYLTMAEHSVFATALCLRVDPSRDTIEFANGGHPPAFLRSVDGRIDQLDSTTFVLGVVHDDVFTPGQRSIPFGPGDAMVAYTDGATEATDSAGRMLCIEGVRRVVASDHPEIQRSMSRALLEAVDNHRHGPIQDDTLVVEIRRPLGAPAPSPDATLSAV